MASLIYYKFKSLKDYDVFKLDAGLNGVTVWEFKKEIIEQKRLVGKLAKDSGLPDFDLLFQNAQTGEEYLNDQQVIPRNSQIIVRRVPSYMSKGGGGGGRAFSTSSSLGTGAFVTKPLLPTGFSMGAGGQTQSEQSKIRSMLSATNSHWEGNQANITTNNQQQLAQSASSRTKKIPTQHVGPRPPDSYVCFRCNSGGHYIQHCPTNSDPNFDKSRIRKTTGIPKTFLQAVKDEAIAAVSASTSQDSNETQMLMDAEGHLVMAPANEKEWERLTNMQKFISAAAEEEEDDGLGITTTTTTKPPPSKRAK